MFCLVNCLMGYTTWLHNIRWWVTSKIKAAIFLFQKWNFWESIKVTFFKDTAVSKEISLCLFLTLMLHLIFIHKKSLHPPAEYYGFKNEYTHHQVKLNISNYARLVFSVGHFAFYLKFFQKVSKKLGSFTILTVVVAKGEQRSNCPKGGKYVKPNSHEQSKRHTFDRFCKKLLKHGGIITMSWKYKMDLLPFYYLFTTFQDKNIKIYNSI